MTDRRPPVSGEPPMCDGVVTVNGCPKCGAFLHPSRPPVSGEPTCSHAADCICTEADHSDCCGVRRSEYLAYERPPVSGEPSTARSVLLDHLRKYPALDTSMRLIEKQLDAIEAEARATPPSLDVERLAWALEHASDPEDPKRSVVPTGYSTLLSSEIPTIRRRQADLIADKYNRFPASRLTSKEERP